MRLYAHQLTEMLFVLSKVGITDRRVVKYLDDIQKVVAFYKKVSQYCVSGGRAVYDLRKNRAEN